MYIFSANAPRFFFLWNIAFFNSLSAMVFRRPAKKPLLSSACCLNPPMALHSTKETSYKVG